MNPIDDPASMAARYARRAELSVDRYSPLNPEVQARVHERQRATARLLVRLGLNDIGSLDILEIGCGSGSNLLEWLQLGASPERLIGNEILADRLAFARQRLPTAVQLHAGDASRLHLADSSFDIVHQSTVFSSLLDDAFQRRLADRLWSLLRPGGGVLWYDFTYDNPRNPDVRGVPLTRVRELFPHATFKTNRITLAPPLSRRVVKLHPTAYQVLNALPFLRTHLLCWIGKPR